MLEVQLEYKHQLDLYSLESILEVFSSSSVTAQWCNSECGSSKVTTQEQVIGISLGRSWTLPTCGGARALPTPAYLKILAERKALGPNILLFKLECSIQNASAHERRNAARHPVWQPGTFAAMVSLECWEKKFMDQCPFFWETRGEVWISSRPSVQISYRHVVWWQFISSWKLEFQMVRVHMTRDPESQRKRYHPPEKCLRSSENVWEYPRCTVAIGGFGTITFVVQLHLPDFSDICFYIQLQLSKVWELSFCSSGSGVSLFHKQLAGGWY